VLRAPEKATFSRKCKTIPRLGAPVIRKSGGGGREQSVREQVPRGFPTLPPPCEVPKLMRQQTPLTPPGYGTPPQDFASRGQLRLPLWRILPSKARWGNPSKEFRVPETVRATPPEDSGGTTPLPDYPPQGPLGPPSRGLSAS